MPTTGERGVRAAHDLHDFLRDWLIGALPRTAEAFAPFDEAMAPDLRVISPLGTLTLRDDLLNEFEGTHGVLSGKAGAFEIRVENDCVLHDLGEWAVVNYEEWHVLDGEASARLATVLYRRREGAPNGVEWVHVHETWLPGRVPTGGERFPQPA